MENLFRNKAFLEFQGKNKSRLSSDLNASSYGDSLAVVVFKEVRFSEPSDHRAHGTVSFCFGCYSPSTII